MSFLIYLSNIGGLVSLWFGMSFIDMNSIIKLITIKTYNLIISIINCFIIRKFITFINLNLNILTRLKKDYFKDFKI